MPRTTILKHYGKFVQRREDFLNICANDDCAAQLLDLLEYWTECRLTEVDRIKSWNANATKNGRKPKTVPSLWLYETIEDFQSGLIEGYGQTYIKARLKWLKNWGYIRVKGSENKFDQTREYFLEVGAIQNALDGWNALNNAFLDQSNLTDTNSEESNLTLDSSKMTVDHRSNLTTDHESNLTTDLYLLNSHIKNHPLSLGEEEEEEEEEKEEQIQNEEDSNTSFSSLEIEQSLPQESNTSHETKYSATSFDTFPPDQCDNNKKWQESLVAHQAKLESRYKYKDVQKYLDDEGFQEWYASDRLAHTTHWKNCDRKPTKHDAKRSLRTKSKQDAGDVVDLWEAYQEQRSPQVSVQPRYVPDYSPKPYNPKPVLSQEQLDLHAKTMQELLAKKAGLQA